MDTFAERILKSELFPNYQIKITEILLLLIAGISFGFLVQILWNRRFLYYCSWKMPGPSPAWPILGNALYFIGDPDDILHKFMKLTREFKSPWRLWVGHRLFFVITQPKDLEIVLNRSLHKDRVYDFGRPLVGTGIFSAPLNKWKPHRKVIAQTFNPKILNSFVEIFEEQSNVLVEKLEKFNGKGCFDVFPLISRCALDLICETAMGKKVDAQSQEADYAKCIERAMEILIIRVFRLWFHLDCVWHLSPLSKELHMHHLEIKKLTLKIIEEKKQEYRKSESSGRKVFIDHLIELSEEGENWDDREILEEALTLVMAGSDTTSTMGSFALIMLAMHQDIQQKVFEELQTIFNEDFNRKITPADLPQMVYLERVIKETLRLFPAAPIVARAIHEDLKLDSYTLPKNTSCAVAAIHTHRDPELWPDPLKFDPDRFLPEETAKRHPYSYFPFSAGPRNCVGPKYAMMSMKTLISTILRHYKITSTNYKSVADIKLKTTFVIKAAEGYKIALIKRYNVL